ncbi:MAG TPA: FAD-dependent oxidoreductase [Isosphaeraceae bacterium]|nr:FAD-dependent oxidoreductase [Isosphaeraceae bacterium]
MIKATGNFDAAGEATWDALVIGAGPAGALAARQLAQAGVRVLLVERNAFPRWKVCSACLNGQALSVLDAIGLEALVPSLGRDRAEGVPPEPRRTLDVAPLAGRRGALPGAARLRPSGGRDGRRGALPTGAPGARRGDRGRHTPRPARPPRSQSCGAARVVLAAGGLGHRCLEHEPVLRTRAATWSRVGAGCDVAAVPDLYRKATIFMAVARGGDVGLVRVEDGCLNVAAAFDRDFLRHHGRPRRAASAVLATSGFPALAPLDDADWQGTVRLTRTTRPLAAERLFLLGDATGYVEPFTGEGMGWALTSARAVAPLALRAIERWDPALPRAWSGLHRDLVGHRQRLCRGVATLLRHPRLARMTLDLVALAPAVARLIIGSVNAPALLSRAN